MEKNATQAAPDGTLFYNAFKASPIGIALENLEGQPLFVNHALCSMLGFSEEELRSKHCVEFSPPEDAARDWTLFAQLRAGSIDHYQVDKRFYRRDGSLIWGRLNISLLKNLTPPLVVAMVEDITERKRAEEELSQSNERLQLTMEAGRIGGWEWDIRNGRNLWFGQKHALLGMPDDLPTSTQEFWDRVHPDDRGWLRDAVEKAMRTHTELVVEFRVVWPDGSVHWLHSQARFFYGVDGQAERMLGMSSEVTEQKRAEETLRENEEKFRSVFRDAGVGMVVVSPGGRFLAANGTFCDYLGYSEEELLTKNVQSVTFPEDWPAFSQKLTRALTEGVNFQRFEKRCLHKSGRIVYTESTASLIRNREGIPQYFVGGVLNITRRKQAEEMLSSINRRLIEAQEQERTRIGRDLHDDLGQRLAMLGMEIEQLRQYPPSSIAEVSLRLAEVQQHLSEALAGVQSVSHQLHSPELEYLGVLAAMRSFCREFAVRQSVEIDFTYDDIPQPVSHEVSVCLFRILQEAVHNAAKHSNVRHFKVRLGCSGKQLHLTVTDQGLGFNPEAVTNKGGLGLISMRERVRLVKGTIAIESQPQAGTTIHVSVPFQLERPLPAAG